jgi:hypothetical protein
MNISTTTKVNAMNARLQAEIDAISPDEELVSRLHWMAVHQDRDPVEMLATQVNLRQMTQAHVDRVLALYITTYVNKPTMTPFMAAKVIDEALRDNPGSNVDYLPSGHGTWLGAFFDGDHEAPALLVEEDSSDAAFLALAEMIREHLV